MKLSDVWCMELCLLPCKAWCDKSLLSWLGRCDKAMWDGAGTITLAPDLSTAWHCSSVTPLQEIPNIACDFFFFLFVDRRARRPFVFWTCASRKYMFTTRWPVLLVASDRLSEKIICKSCLLLCKPCPVFECCALMFYSFSANCTWSWKTSGVYN